MEALHLEYVIEEGASGDAPCPYDGTPTKNATVTNCRFFNCFAGIGTHHYVTENHAENITVSDNVSNFSHILGGAVGSVIGYRLNVKKSSQK